MHRLAQILLEKETLDGDTIDPDYSRRNTRRPPRRDRTCQAIPVPESDHRIRPPIEGSIFFIPLTLNDPGRPSSHPRLFLPGMVPRKTYNLIWGNHRLSLGEKTRIMGVLNVTPDSFSDGGSVLFNGTGPLPRGRPWRPGGGSAGCGRGIHPPFFRSYFHPRRTGPGIVPVIRELVQRISIPISVDTY